MNASRAWFGDNREGLFNAVLMVFLIGAGLENVFTESGTLDLALGVVFTFFGVVGLYLVLSGMAGG